MKMRKSSKGEGGSFLGEKGTNIFIAIIILLIILFIIGAWVFKLSGGSIIDAIFP